MRTSSNGVSALLLAGGTPSPEQLDVDAVRGFRNELVKDYSANSARKHLEYVPFFRFCPCSRVHSREGTGATPRERENRSNNWCNDVT